MALGVDLARLPRHVAFIMDGNGRWAKQFGKSRTFGHRAGVKVVRDLVKSCRALGIEVMTVYAFSTENWGRPNDEVTFLMRLFEEVIKKELGELSGNGVQIRFIGDIQALAPKLQEIMRAAEAQTKGNGGLVLNVAINYGGRHEILNAVHRLAEQVKAGTLEPAAIDEQMLSAHLFTAGLPDPDLVIRTSGESRISNYLLWQMAYSEIYITQTLWPDFSDECFYRALVDYQRRDRRYGQV